MEFDFYTAVDDLKPRGDAGADMMGTIQFNSACFYRYSLVDLDQLARTLSGAAPGVKLDPLAKKAASEAAKAWLVASVSAIPSARQNGFAAFTPPEVVLSATRRTGSPLSLANAFVEPIRPGTKEGEDLVTRSSQALGKHLGNLTSLYGTDGARFRLATARDELSFAAGGTSRATSFGALVDDVMKDLAEWEASP
jgi:CRISPR system Cascade subunit CasC